jgi:hypothetical protein
MIESEGCNNMIASRMTPFPNGAATTQQPAPNVVNMPSKSEVIEALKDALNAGDNLVHQSVPTKATFFQRLWYGRTFTAHDYEIRMHVLGVYRSHTRRAAHVLSLCEGEERASKALRAQDPSTEDHVGRQFLQLHEPTSLRPWRRSQSVHPTPPLPRHG